MTYILVPLFLLALIPNRTVRKYKRLYGSYWLQMIILNFTKRYADKKNSPSKENCSRPSRHDKDGSENYHEDSCEGDPRPGGPASENSRQWTAQTKEARLVP